jgi:hypothetical protein
MMPMPNSFLMMSILQSRSPAFEFVAVADGLMTLTPAGPVGMLAFRFHPPCNISITLAVGSVPLPHVVFFFLLPKLLLFFVIS